MPEQNTYNPTAIENIAITGQAGESWKSSYRRIHEFFIHMAFLDYLKRQANTGISDKTLDNPNLFAATAEVIQAYLIEQRAQLFKIVQKTDNLLRIPEANISAIHEDGVREIMREYKKRIQHLPNEEKQLEASFEQLTESAINQISDTSTKTQVQQTIKLIKQHHFKFIKQYVKEVLEGIQEIDLSDIHDSMQEATFSAQELEARALGKSAAEVAEKFKSLNSTEKKMHGG